MPRGREGHRSAAGAGGWSRAGRGRGCLPRSGTRRCGRTWISTPTPYQHERAERLGASQQGICAALKRLKITRKKRCRTRRPTRRGRAGSRPGLRPCGRRGADAIGALLTGPVNAGMLPPWVVGGLPPKLPPGCAVAMDNVAFRKRADIRRATEEAGHVLALLPLSPALNPIARRAQMGRGQGRPQVPDAAPSRSSSRTAPCDCFWMV